MRPSWGWASRSAAELLGELGVDMKNALGPAIDEVTFYNADFSKSAVPNLDGPAAYVLRRESFDEALVKAARKAKADIREETTVKDFRLSEKGVTLIPVDGEPVEGRFLVLATGVHPTFIAKLGLHVPSIAEWSVLSVTHKVKSGAKIKNPRFALILGIDRAGGYAIAAVAEDEFTVGVATTAERSVAIGLLMQVCRGLAENDIVPEDIAPQAAGAQIMHGPAGAAMAMDSHVGKHALLVGDAGGFISSGSHEGIYPAMWSARIAADIIHEAADDQHPQDILQTFDSKWRIEMADYLRMPNSDIQFLLPLIFSNQTMTDRMGAAFFLGHNM
jgi:flavin-dependent dehydrogenase